MDNAQLIYQALPIAESGYIVGVALFDLSGLPISYYTTAKPADITWVQGMFQALGLKSLLSSSFQLQGFEQVLIRSAQGQLIVSRRSDRYLGLWTHQVTANLQGALSHLVA